MKYFLSLAALSLALSMIFTEAEARGHKGGGHRNHHHHDFIWNKHKIYCGLNGVSCALR